MKLLLTYSLLCLLMSPRVTAQSDTTASVSIVTNPSGADVVVDSMYAGKSPVRNFSVGSGNHVIKAFYPSMFAWNPAALEDTLVVSGTGHIERHLELGTSVRIQSDPPGSAVMYAGTVLGVTPLYLRRTTPLQGDLTLQMEGFTPRQISSDEIKNGFIQVMLEKLGPNGSLLSAGDLVASDKGVSDHWLAYASGATMILSGTASAYVKIQANNEFNRYLQTNNPASLSKTQRLDREAAGALILSEIGLAVLSYILLSE